MPGMPNAVLMSFASRTRTMPSPAVIEVGTASAPRVANRRGQPVATTLAWTKRGTSSGSSYESATRGGSGGAAVNRFAGQSDESYAAAGRLIAPQRHENVAVPED